MRKLETKRLILRDWEESDIGCDVFDDRTIRYLLTAKNNYAVVLKENEKVIGTIGLNEDADGNDNIRNVGIRILEQYRGMGLMSEALTEVINCANEITDALSYFCKADDIRSQHIAEKLGFKYVKTFYNVRRSINDVPFDFKYYILHVNTASG